MTAIPPEDRKRLEAALEGMKENIVELEGWLKDPPEGEDPADLEVELQEERQYAADLERALEENDLPWLLEIGYVSQEEQP